MYLRWLRIMAKLNPETFKYYTVDAPGTPVPRVHPFILFSWFHLRIHRENLDFRILTNTQTHHDNSEKCSYYDRIRNNTKNQFTLHTRLCIVTTLVQIIETMRIFVLVQVECHAVV